MTDEERAREVLQEMWDAYAEQQCGWQDAASYHGHTQCSKAGVGAAGLVFEDRILSIQDILTQPVPDHFDSKTIPEEYR